MRRVPLTVRPPARAARAAGAGEVGGALGTDAAERSPCAHASRTSPPATAAAPRITSRLLEVAPTTSQPGAFHTAGPPHRRVPLPVARPPRARYLGYDDGPPIGRAAPLVRGRARP